MIIGRVEGAIYSTIHHPFYANRRLLIVRQLDIHGRPTPDYLIAVDSVDAGMGETVLVINEGNSARQVMDDPVAPVRSVIVGIIDEIQVAGEEKA